MANMNLTGKRLLITAGRPREDIDGIRHYANHKRAEGHGYAVAEMLAACGADVTVVAPESTLIDPRNCRVVQHSGHGQSIKSGHDVMQATAEQVIGGPYDAVLCLASISSIKSAQQFKHKLKIKSLAGDLVSMAIAGNIDIENITQALGIPALGYTSWQETFRTPDLPLWLSNIAQNIENHQNAVQFTAILDSKREEFLSVAPPTLRNKKIIITSGPTEETVTATGDVITNFSSGRQGHELALAFANCGAEVVYVVGPTGFAAPTHGSIQSIKVRSAKTMLAACKGNLPADVFVGVAAVADFGCIKPSPLRLTENKGYTLALDQNPDILETMGQHQWLRPALVVGFAAETDPHNILAYAKGKLFKKGADLICANLIEKPSAQGTKDNQVFFVTRDAEPRRSKAMSKRDIAFGIAEEIINLLSEEAQTRTEPFSSVSRLKVLSL